MEYSPVEIIESSVTISLPEWVCDEKYERRVIFYVPKGDRYGGSYDRDKWENMIEDELYKYVHGIQASMFHPMNCNVEVEIDSHTDIKHTIAEIEEVLERFRDEEYVKEATRTKYINHPEGLCYDQ